MYIADMHCDSLLKVNADKGLVSEYNISGKNPQLQFFASYMPARGKTPEARRRATVRNLDIYAYECERLGIIKVDDVRSLYYATDNGLRAGMFTIEGGGGLFADSDELFMLHKAGLRVMSLAWDSNELAASAFCDDDYGLTPEGIRMAKRCAELGIIIDVSHLSDKSFFDLSEVYPMPLIATHSNFRDVCPSKRNLTYEMAKLITGRGGVIGINLYPDFVKEGGAHAEDILGHVDYCLEHFGDGALGFGFDIDGTDGRYPIGFTEQASIHDQAADLLLNHYSASTVERIIGENVLDFLRGNL
jgi:membrane dipeptidase